MEMLILLLLIQAGLAAWVIGWAILTVLVGSLVVFVRARRTTPA